jgi:hypothetical protein
MASPCVIKTGALGPKLAYRLQLIRIAPGQGLSRFQMLAGQVYGTAKQVAFGQVKQVVQFARSFLRSESCQSEHGLKIPTRTGLPALL